ncbi:MAG: histidine kinase [Treponema sp.]|jgi:LytS/YehU family sensor histidine kinase|nr:histidine kinase [Treponema sp.]
MQFSLLQSQLNPHFLFNTLKNIFWKTLRLTGATNDASRMIDPLSALLRYTLVNRERFVLLEEEIENTRKYIRLVREPGWFSASLWLACKSCKMLHILLFFSGCCSETEVFEQLY